MRGKEVSPEEPVPALHAPDLGGQGGVPTFNKDKPYCRSKATLVPGSPGSPMTP